MSYLEYNYFSKRYGWSMKKIVYARNKINKNNIRNIINVGKSCNFLIKLDHKSF